MKLQSETQPQVVDWEAMLREIEEKCGRDIADAIRHRIAVLNKRVKHLELGEDEERWDWWT